MKRAQKIEEVPGTKGNEFGFSVGLPARTFVFAVDEKDKAKAWVEALRKCQAFEPPREEDGEEEFAENKVECPVLELDARDTEEVQWIDEFDDFPEGMQKIFRKSKLSDADVVKVMRSFGGVLTELLTFPAKNMHVVLNVVRFLYKKRHFKTHLPNPWETEEFKKPEGQDKQDQVLFEEAETMYDEITPKTRKKRFKMIKELGKGGFGVVHLAQWADDKEQVAVKVRRKERWSSVTHCLTGDGARHDAQPAGQSARDLLADKAGPQERGEAETLLPVPLGNVGGARVHGGRHAHRGGALQPLPGERGGLRGSRNVCRPQLHARKHGHSSRFGESAVDLFGFFLCSLVVQKSANVMLTVKAEIKLIDFGLCGDARHTRFLKGMVGSPYWMPPEMIRGQPHS